MCCGYQHGKLGQYHAHKDSAKTYPEDKSKYCLCPGYKVDVEWSYDGGTSHVETATPYDGPEITPENVEDLGECCGEATGDDGLCDRCRENCKSVIEEVAEKGSIETPLNSN